VGIIEKTKAAKNVLNQLKALLTGRAAIQ